MGIDVDAWIEKVKACEVLAEDELKILCEYVRHSRWTTLLLRWLAAAKPRAWQREVTRGNAPAWFCKATVLRKVTWMEMNLLLR